jgi:hypothetical protein
MDVLIAISIILSGVLLAFFGFYFLFNLHVLINLSNWIFYPFIASSGLYFCIAPLPIVATFLMLLALVCIVVFRLICKIKAFAIAKGEALEA